MSKFTQPETTPDSANAGKPLAAFSLQKLKNINLQVFVMLAAIAVIIVFFSLTTEGAYFRTIIFYLLRHTRSPLWPWDVS